MTRRKVVPWLPLLGVLMLIVNGGLFWQAHRTSTEQARLQRQVAAQQACQARVNQQLVLALRARNEAAEAERVATDRFWLELGRPGATPEDRRRVYEEYIAARRKADRQRTENPLPEPPSETCR